MSLRSRDMLVRAVVLFMMAMPAVAYGAPAPPDTVEDGALGNWDDPDGTLITDPSYTDGDVFVKAGRVSKSAEDMAKLTWDTGFSPVVGDTVTFHITKLRNFGVCTLSPYNSSTTIDNVNVLDATPCTPSGIPPTCSFSYTLSAGFLGALVDLGGASFAMRFTCGGSSLVDRAEVSEIEADLTPPECSTDPDCDDGNSCTLDVCTAGTCSSTPTNEGLSCDDLDPCSIGETCQSGVCMGGAPPGCSGSGDQCNTASCDGAGAEGNCDTWTPVANGTSCDDTDACNIGETCQTGLCTGGTPPDCSGASDQCNTAWCDVAGAEGNCDMLTPLGDGNPCDDADACNVGETCQAGVCSGGGQPDCMGWGDQCNTASCDSAGADGNCDMLTPVFDGMLCDDSNACLVGETCETGVCTGGAPPDCSGASDQCNTASCDGAGAEGNCDTVTPVASGTSCDDTNACIVGETCQTGVCSGGAPPDCSGASDQCNTAWCDVAGAEGNCDMLTPLGDGNPCDDADACNVGETCQAGVCTGGAHPDCAGWGDQCNTASCDSAGADGNCDMLTPVADGTLCDDSDTCLVGETCQTGVCFGGAAPDCSGSGDQCNMASCDGAGAEGNCDTWTPVANDTSCDDTIACNVGETCQAGVCTGGVAPDCSGSGDQCNTVSCDGAGVEGNCDTLTPANEGLSCDDSDACNIGETCQGGFCFGGAAPDCSGSGDQCNAASCDGAGVEGNCDTLTPANEGLSCDDANACNLGEICQSGACTGGAAPDCSGSGDQCNTAFCDGAGAEGNCDTLTPVANGTSCDDSDACNVGEACQAGVCAGGAAPDCSGSGDQCNAASCDGAGAEGNCDTLTPANGGMGCDDGDPCNLGETCQVGVCMGGIAPDCSAAGDQCNTGSCDPAGIDGNCDTLAPVVDGTTCDDGVNCTDAICSTGACVFSANSAQVTVNLDVDAIGDPATRDVQFVITTCGGAVDARVVAVGFGASGSGSSVISGVDVNASWISVTEGHTLRRLAALPFVSCAATVNLTGAGELASGDFQTAAVSQDNLVDITDFSILAGSFNSPVADNLSTGADATGDGIQGTADFTAIQVNFLTVGDAVDSCAAEVVREGPLVEITPIDDALLGRSAAVRTSATVTSLQIPNAWLADLDNNGVVDARDIRAFARLHNLPLLPEFDRRLRQLEAKTGKRRNVETSKAP